ncbi:MAG: zinc-ribbon domain-containing protein [Oscillospiraceae bacterium]|nr:zinc-ribbon domain-containing protein [Oscillospiraceae bacterium]MCL2280235.1 zinc-ribbon domain-containing protein [Oscillospiraceae bacterium]
MKKFCGKCGNENKPGIKFCGKCGAPVETKQHDDHEPIFALDNKSPNKKVHKTRRIAIATLIFIALSGLGFAMLNGFFDRADATPLSYEPEIFHYIYRSDVIVINQPTYNFVEINGTVIITVYNPSEAIQQLTVGDTFVLEPTAQNPGGMSGHILDVATQGTAIIITARLPESLEEIFYEFELIDTVDVLELVDEIILDDELSNIEGIEISRNHTSNVTLWARRANIGGVILDGELSIQRPVVRRSISLRHVNYLILETGIEVNLEATARGSFNRIIPLFTVPVRIVGTGLDIPVGIRVSGSGEISLVLVVGVDAEFGIRDNQFIADLEPRYSLEFDFDARATISANIQARARVLWIPVYGVQVDIGKGVQSNADMQDICPQRICFVVETFHVRSVRSLNWGVLSRVQALHFNEDLAQNIPSTIWYLINWTRYSHCPHGGYAPISTPAPAPALDQPAVTATTASEYIRIPMYRFGNPFPIQGGVAGIVDTYYVITFPPEPIGGLIHRILRLGGYPVIGGFASSGAREVNWVTLNVPDGFVGISGIFGLRSYETYQDFLRGLYNPDNAKGTLTFKADWQEIAVFTIEAGDKQAMEIDLAIPPGTQHLTIVFWSTHTGYYDLIGGIGGYARFGFGSTFFYR